MAQQIWLRDRIRPGKGEDDPEDFGASDPEEQREHDEDSESLSLLSSAKPAQRRKHHVDTENSEDSEHSRLQSEASGGLKDLEEQEVDVTPSPASSTDHGQAFTFQTIVNPTANISFGALASAQESLGKLKRKRPATSQVEERRRSPSPFHEARERAAGKKRLANDDRLARASQHAPTEVSSKKAVSRKRTVVHVPASTARDPRFSSLSGPTKATQVEEAYDFLNDYRQSELVALKKEARETKDPRRKRNLEFEVRAEEDRERTRQRDRAEQEVRRAHRRKEREEVAKGKRPFFLKESDVKRQVLQQKFADLGPKKAERIMERRRKKRAAKDRRLMPRERRQSQADQ